MSGKEVCVGCTCACALVLSIIMTLICVKSVEPTEYGVVYNTISQKVTVDDVRTNGIYWLGFFNSFQLYPATVLTMEFSNSTEAANSPLSVKDKTGNSISLAISLQYQLQQDHIGDIYNSYKFNYEQYYITQIKTQASEMFSSYVYSDLWNKREEIGTTLQTSVNAALSPMFADCLFLQIIDIVLPSSIESSIVSTEVSTQQSDTKSNEQIATNIRAQKDVYTSEAQKNVTLYQGYATANATQLTGSATSYYQSHVLSSQGDAYKLAATTLGMDTSLDDMLNYIYFTNMVASDQTVLVGINNVLVNSS